ncbi:iron-containing alcohol dehydrogenase [Lichenihabitans psoromatis]|uniref:iron-containing alcohol dehydrogenase n=1 Tax=Lichenihabitans psoromatis TaxID=2528642 RepID=UPI001038354A|nr:iron-containing alcohol dehydrogenase [Lichenihabitans psoromatis]
MDGFTFDTVPTIICEAGALKRIGTLAADRIGRRVLIVTDRGLASSAIVTDALKSLEAAGVSPVVFYAVTADPAASIVQAAADMAREARVEGIIGLGGGSSMDVAKLAALIAPGSQPLEALYGVDKAVGKRLPLMLVPTTAGTGSEVTPIAIVTTGHHQKMGVSSRLIIPDVALLDPFVTIGLPKAITAATGLDAMVHAIEAYTSISPRNNPLSRMLSETAIRLLASNLRRAVDHGEDVDARGAMLLGAMLAGQAFANSPVGAVHALAYPIGSRFGVPHGMSNAVVLLHVMRFNRSACAPGYAALAPFAFPHLAGLGQAEQVDGFIDGLAGLMRDTAIPSTLGEVGIVAADVNDLANDAMAQTRLLQNNPRNMTYNDARAIYRAAL